jgi:hypothetical protein
VGIRHKLRGEAQKYLAAGERTQAVMWGTAIRPLWGVLLGPFADWWGNYRAVICTDQRILLCRGGQLTASLDGILETLDREVQLGPPRGLYFHHLTAFSSPVYVARSFFKDVRQADMGVDQYRS